VVAGASDDLCSIAGAACPHRRASSRAAQHVPVTQRWTRQRSISSMRSWLVKPGAAELLGVASQAPPAAAKGAAGGIDEVVESSSCRALRRRQQGSTSSARRHREDAAWPLASQVGLKDRRRGLLVALAGGGEAALLGGTRSGTANHQQGPHPSTHKRRGWRGDLGAPLELVPD
jgi:hypothetical protein